MSKPIPTETREAFTEFLNEQEDEFFCWGDVEDALELESEEWEFHAANHDPDTTHDIYELFDGRVEQHGCDDFCKAS